MHSRCSPSPVARGVFTDALISEKYVENRPNHGALHDASGKEILLCNK